jgi:hypothetical protein
LGASFFDVSTKGGRVSLSKRGLVSVGLLLAAIAGLILLPSIQVRAAGLTSTNIRFNRMKAATATTFRLTFTVPAGNAATEASVYIAFPDAYTVATTGLTADASSCGATALPGTLSVTGSNTASSKNITVAGVTNLTATSTYCVDIDKTTTHDPLTNPTSGLYSLSVTTRTSVPASIDTSTIGARVISDDQVVVTAVVPPSFNFVLDANTTAFTSGLDSATVIKTTARTVTITTNATQGWIAWAKDLNTGLTSAAAGKTIASTTPGTAATLVAGTEGYVLGVDKTDAGGGGTVTVDTAYVGTAGNSNGSGLDTAFRQIASADGTANGDVLTLIGKAAINAMTPAGIDYTDTWTVIGAGSF